MEVGMADPQTARIVRFPDLKPATRRQILGSELGSQWDVQDRMYSFYSDGAVFDYSEWTSRDMAVMLQRDGQAAAVEAVLTLPIRQASRAIEKGKGDSGEAEFVRSVLMAPETSGGMKTPLQDVIGQITSAQTFRKSFHERVYSQRDSDGKIVYEKLAFRPAATCEQKRDAQSGADLGFRQQTWAFGGVLAGQKQSKLPGYVDIPKIRAWTYVNGKHRDPLRGVSEMELCYWAYSTKLKLLFLWYQFLETQSLPKVVVYGQDPKEAAAKADDIASMRSSGVVGFQRPPSGEKTFEILESAGTGGAQFQQALQFLESWQTQSVLAGFLGLSNMASLGRGSLALSQDQSAFFLKSRQAVTAEMEAALTHDVIAPLVTLNFGPGASYPSFRFGALTDESDAALVQLFQAMSVAPELQVPAGILDIITMRLASYLNLDVSAIEQVIQEGARERAAQAQQVAPPGMPPEAAAGIGALAGGVGAADRIARAAIKQASMSPQPENIAQPFSAPPVTTGAPKA
jgi:hypothetical protein